jgi:hypothetical protein
MEKKQVRIQLGIDIDLEMRQQIKMLAAARNIPMCTWIKRALLEKIHKDTREPIKE